jgi:hypothetical protein
MAGKNKKGCLIPAARLKKSVHTDYGVVSFFIFIKRNSFSPGEQSVQTIQDKKFPPFFTTIFVFPKCTVNNSLIFSADPSIWRVHQSRMPDVRHSKTLLLSAGTVMLLA